METLTIKTAELLDGNHLVLELSDKTCRIMTAEQAAGLPIPSGAVLDGLPEEAARCLAGIVGALDQKDVRVSDFYKIPPK